MIAHLKQYRFDIALISALCALAFLTVGLMKPDMQGDSYTYTDSVQVLRTGVVPEKFLPHRITADLGSLLTIMAIDTVTGQLTAGWLGLNIVLYVIAGYFFYRLLNRFFQSRITALIGMTLFVTNYAMLTAGLGYLVDMGGWAFYVVSLYTALLFYETNNRRYLWLTAMLAGIGATFKEPGGLGSIALAGIILLQHGVVWKRKIVDLLRVGIVSVIPLAAAYIFTYVRFDFTYANWYSKLADWYNFGFWEKILEDIKVFGSMYNLGWLLAFSGIVLIVRGAQTSIRARKDVLFFALVLVSSLPVLVWPVLIQRIVFPVIIPLIFISCVCIKKYERYWPAFFPLLIAYMLVNYYMDAYVLDYVNINALFFW